MCVQYLKIYKLSVKISYSPDDDDDIKTLFYFQVNMYYTKKNYIDIA